MIHADISTVIRIAMTEASSIVSMYCIMYDIALMLAYNITTVSFHNFQIAKSQIERLKS